MPAQVYYQIPIATDSIRLVIGGFCLVCVVAIFGSWLPRVVRWLVQLRRAGDVQSMTPMALVLVPAAVGTVPLIILIVLIRNPMTYVSDGGVIKEALLSKETVSFSWADIAHVSCRAGRGAGPRWFTLTSTDGRTMGLGNPGGFDFVSLHALLDGRLGPVVMQGCPRAVRHLPSAEGAG